MPEQTRAKAQKPERGVSTRPTSPARHAPILDVQQATIQRMLAAPSTLSPAHVVQLQRSIGNGAVAQLLGKAAMPGVAIQPKLQVGPADDRYEEEADRIATSVQRSVTGGTMQRAPSVQRGGAMGAEGGVLRDDLATKIGKSQGAGQAMPQGVRAALEPQLGADLSSVKVHTDHQAVQLNRDLGAKAFTHKNHIYYGAGQRPTDLQLTAHETVHTIQQGAVAQRRTSNQDTVQAKRQTGQNPVQAAQAVSAMNANRIQRLSVNDKPIKFNKATAVTLSVGGADGVYFFHEGPLYAPGSTVAVKPSDDAVGDTVATNALLNKVSGGKVPKTIAGNQYKSAVRNILADPSMDQSWTDAWNKKIAAEQNPVPQNDPYLGTADKFKAAKLDRFDTADHLYVMGLAGGQSFREKVSQGQNATADVLMPKDLIKLGRATAVDLFMGNADRLVQGNLGNWMIGVDKTLYLIDNVQAADLKKLRENTDHTVTWDTYLEKLQSGNIENTASRLARKILLSADISNKEDINLGAKKGQVVENVGWAGMIGTRKRPGKKDPTKLIDITERELKQEHLSVQETYLMTWLKQGLIKGRNDIIRKLAPSRGQRSRSLKNKIVGGGGTEQWDEIKERAKKLKDLG